MKAHRKSLEQNACYTGMLAPCCYLDLSAWADLQHHVIQRGMLEADVRLEGQIKGGCLKDRGAEPPRLLEDFERRFSASCRVWGAKPFCQAGEKRDDLCDQDKSPHCHVLCLFSSKYMLEVKFLMSFKTNNAPKKQQIFEVSLKFSFYCFCVKCVCLLVCGIKLWNSLLWNSLEYQCLDVKQFII